MRIAWSQPIGHSVRPSVSQLAFQPATQRRRDTDSHVLETGASFHVLQFTYHNNSY